VHVDRRRFTVVLVLLLSLLAGSTAAARSSHHRGRGSGGALRAIGTLPSPSVFGVDTAVFDSSRAGNAKQIPTAGSLGARWVHFTLGASTATGGYAIVDAEVRKARKDHLGVLLSFGGIARACSIHPLPANVHACPPASGRLGVYGAYIRRALERYRNVVQYYESWTEPNYKSSWAPGPNPSRYAAVLKTQYAAVQFVNRKYHKHLKRLCGSPVECSIGRMPGWTGVLAWTDQVLSVLKGERPFDGIALHAYRLPPNEAGPGTVLSDYVGGIAVRRGARGPFPGEGCDSTPQCAMTWPQELSAYEQEFADHGYGQQPLWLTEFGWPGNAVARGELYPSYATQAAYLRQAYEALMALPFVKAAFWFNLRDYQPGYPSGDPPYFYHYGLLNYDFSQKPAAATFSTLAKSNPDR
jgi:hypothetical protein